MEKLKKEQIIKTKNIITIILVVSFLIAVIVAGNLGLFDNIKLNELKKFQEWINSFGYFAYIVFVIIYVICVIIPLPAATMTIFGGIIFGVVRGTLLSLTGYIIGATLAFLLTRYLFRDYIVKKLGNTTMFKKIENGVEKNGVDFLILTRLVPIFPITLQNYIYGVTNMKLGVYVVVSAITMFPGVFLYTFLANDIVADGFTLKTISIFAIACLALYVLSLLLKRVAHQMMITNDKTKRTKTTNGS